MRVEGKVGCMRAENERQKSQIGNGFHCFFSFFFSLRSLTFVPVRLAQDLVTASAVLRDVFSHLGLSDSAVI